MSIMQMLFDQDYIWDVHVKSEVRQAREEEREKAAKREKEAEDKGILIAIASLRKHKISDTDILQDIMENYHLDCSTAEKYMAMQTSASAKE